MMMTILAEDVSNRSLALVTAKHHRDNSEFLCSVQRFLHRPLVMDAIALKLATLVCAVPIVVRRNVKEIIAHKLFSRDNSGFLCSVQS